MSCECKSWPPERKPAFKTAREVVLDLAADVLYSIGQKDLARQVATVPVPLLDGGPDLHVGTETDNGWQVERRSHQAVPRDKRPDDPVFIKTWTR